MAGDARADLARHSCVERILSTAGGVPAEAKWHLCEERAVVNNKSRDY